MNTHQHPHTGKYLSKILLPPQILSTENVLSVEHATESFNLCSLSLCSLSLYVEGSLGNFILLLRQSWVIKTLCPLILCFHYTENYMLNYWHVVWPPMSETSHYLYFKSIGAPRSWCTLAWGKVKRKELVYNHNSLIQAYLFRIPIFVCNKIAWARVNF